MGIVGEYGRSAAGTLVTVLTCCFFGSFRTTSSDPSLTPPNREAREEPEETTEGAVESGTKLRSSGREGHLLLEAKYRADLRYVPWVPLGSCLQQGRAWDWKQSKWRGDTERRQFPHLV